MENTRLTRQGGNAMLASPKLGLFKNIKESDSEILGVKAVLKYALNNYIVKMVNLS